MKFYIIAGEASGDMHAANLVREMKARYPSAQFRGLGGDRMSAEGVQLLHHYRETAFMGFWEVITHLKKILGFIADCKKDMEHWQPDAVILVDYPGFNLRIATFAHARGYKVFYYISPQVWAWKASRVQRIRRDVDRMFVILPFEKEFYHKYGYDVDFVGHPLLDEIELHFRHHENVSGDGSEQSKPLVALLPGSRRQEISAMLPIMLEAIKPLQGFRFVVAGVGVLEKEFYDHLIGDASCELVFNQTYALLNASYAALVTSGTATLETALFNVPQVVCYKSSPISYQIARWLVGVKHISLVNLVLDHPLVKELIQHELTPKNLRAQLQHITTDVAGRNEILAGYHELKEKLGAPGASAKTAAAILELTKGDG